MHIGTFTQEGTYQTAARELTELAALGITLIELMPVNEFDGDFGWGYDGVGLYAPYHAYGTPDDLRDFIINNAVYWIKEFHFDGFRLDATQQIFDASDEHIIAAIVSGARAAAGNRKIYIVGENEPQQKNW